MLSLCPLCLRGEFCNHFWHVMESRFRVTMLPFEKINVELHKMCLKVDNTIEKTQECGFEAQAECKVNR
jgi:hypothetical protein